MEGLINRLEPGPFRERALPGPRFSCLDLTAPPRDATQSPPAALDMAQGTKRVLIVDDNAPAAECLAVIISLWGHDVRVVYDGNAGLASAHEYRPQIILLDIGLPGMDGYSLARTIRREPRLHGIMLVAMTGFGRDEDRQRSSEAGFDRHLTKPVEIDELEALVALAPCTG